ncbi:zf-CCHC domain-containing protein [Tanacetum coccineum]|uniref:Zf-CCHC domain-containing protein n=1 Tax=Tanacetum coccineum TaxID=301880 RepID=A0ABQ5J1V8_9ASTR
MLDHGLYKLLDNSIWTNYAALWKVLVLADANGIRENSLKLGAGEDLYALFVGIFTMRQWNRVMDLAVDHLAIQGNASDHSELQEKREQNTSLALKAKKESSDEDSSTFDSENKEYAMSVKDFKKFFKRRGRLVRQPHDERKLSQRNKDDKNDKSKRKCFKYGDLNHLIGECPKLSRNYNQRA